MQVKVDIYIYIYIYIYIIFIFICPREENPLILGLGKCGGKDMVPIWSCVSTHYPQPLGVGWLLCTLA